MSSNKTKVVLLTRDFKIEGEIDLIKGARITDFMNGVQKFMVVTDVTVFDHHEKEIYQGGFINVQVANIQVVLPVED